MKRIILFRHAKSSYKNSLLSDFDRPLSSRGERNARELGKRLFQRGLGSIFFISSPAKRALSTAFIVGNEVQIDRDKIKTLDGLYLASAHQLMNIIKSFSEDISEPTVCVFGHNPGLTDLVDVLLGSFIDNMATCSMAGIDLQISNWDQLHQGSGKLIFFDRPY